MTLNLQRIDCSRTERKSAVQRVRGISEAAGYGRRFKKG